MRLKPRSRYTKADLQEQVEAQSRVILEQENRIASLIGQIHWLQNRLDEGNPGECPACKWADRHGQPRHIGQLHNLIAYVERKAREESLP